MDTVTRRRPKTSFASPGELELLVRGLSLDALAITPMYRRLHALGLEPPRGDSVRISGGGISNVPPEVAIESDRAEHYRQYARWVAAEMGRVARKMDRLRQGLEHNVGPTPGYRQPHSITLGSEAYISNVDFQESLANQGERLRQGTE